MIRSNKSIVSNTPMSTWIDRQLKNSVPTCHPPETLHTSIMAAVRTSRVEGRATHRLPLKWAGAAACLLLLLIGAGLFLAGRETVPASAAGGAGPALAAADTALSVSDRLSRAGPAAIVSPVERELEFINRDLESTGNLLLASLP